MIVKCIENQVGNQLAEEIGLHQFSPKSFPSITPGLEYVVLGISSIVNSEAYGISPVVQVRNDGNGLTFAPLALFEIIDATASKYWILRWSKEHGLTLWPISFYKDFYHDDLLEGVGHIRSDFDHTSAILTEEAMNLRTNQQR